MVCRQRAQRRQLSAVTMPEFWAALLPCGLPRGRLVFTSTLEVLLASLLSCISCFLNLCLPVSWLMSIFWGRASSTEEISHIVGMREVLITFLLNLAHLNIFLIYFHIWLIIWVLNSFKNLNILPHCFHYYRWQVQSQSDSRSFKTCCGFSFCKSIISSFFPLVLHHDLDFFF